MQFLKRLIFPFRIILSFQHHISLSGNIFIYQVYDGNDSSNNRKVFRKIGDADPEIIYEGDRCCYAHIMLGDKIYAIGDYQMFELLMVNM